MVSVARLYGKEGAEPRTVSIETRFQHCDSETRWASVPDQNAKPKSKRKDSVAVLTVVLADRTGYTCLELWRDVAMNICEMAHDWLEDENPVYIRASSFAVVEEKKRFYLKIVDSPATIAL